MNKLNVISKVISIILFFAFTVSSNVSAYIDSDRSTLRAPLQGSKTAGELIEHLNHQPEGDSRPARGADTGFMTRLEHDVAREWLRKSKARAEDNRKRDLEEKYGVEIYAVPYMFLSTGFRDHCAIRDKIVYIDLETLEGEDGETYLQHAVDELKSKIALADEKFSDIEEPRDRRVALVDWLDKTGDRDEVEAVLLDIHKRAAQLPDKVERFQGHQEAYDELYRIMNGIAGRGLPISPVSLVSIAYLQEGINARKKLIHQGKAAYETALQEVGGVLSALLSEQQELEKKRADWTRDDESVYEALSKEIQNVRDREQQLRTEMAKLTRPVRGAAGRQSDTFTGPDILGQTRDFIREFSTTIDKLVGLARQGDITVVEDTGSRGNPEVGVIVKESEATRRQVGLEALGLSVTDWSDFREAVGSEGNAWNIEIPSGSSQKQVEDIFVNAYLAKQGLLISSILERDIPHYTLLAEDCFRNSDNFKRAVSNLLNRRTSMSLTIVVTNEDELGELRNKVGEDFYNWLIRIGVQFNKIDAGVLARIRHTDVEELFNTSVFSIPDTDRDLIEAINEGA